MSIQPKPWLVHVMITPALSSLLACSLSIKLMLAFRRIVQFPPRQEDSSSKRPNNDQKENLSFLQTHDVQ